MNIKLISAVGLCLIISACASPPEASNPSSTEASLAEASYDVSHSISNLSEVAQASHPQPNLEAPPSAASYNMAQLTSVDWSGPVEPLIKQLANASNYQLRVLGTQPAIPVLVTVYAKNTLLADILRDIGYQCGRRANLVIFPDTRVIELRYAKN